MKRLSLSVAFLAALSAAVLLGVDAPKPAAAQSGTRSGSGSRTQTTQQASASFEQKFWNYLTTHSYKDWAPAPGGNGGFQEGQSPHGAFVKLFLNRTAAANSKDLPNGSIIVKENYGPDKKTLMAVTTMYRSEGYNPEGGDWYWVKYNPDGSVAKAPPEMGNMQIAGKVNACIQCHSGSDGEDFSFVND